MTTTRSCGQEACVVVGTNGYQQEYIGRPEYQNAPLLLNQELIRCSLHSPDRPMILCHMESLVTLPGYV